MSSRQKKRGGGGEREKEGSRGRQEAGERQKDKGIKKEGLLAER